MQGPAATEQPAAFHQRASQHAVNAQVLSVEREVDDAPQQSHSWRLEEPADELGMSPGRQQPEQAPAACAVHPGGDDVSHDHAMEDLSQPHAGDSRPDTHGAWLGEWQESRGFSGTASSALWLDPPAAVAPIQSSACLLEGKQLLREHLPAACHSAALEPAVHAHGNVGSRGSCEPVTKMASHSGDQLTQHGIKDRFWDEGSCAPAADSYGAGQSEGSDLVAAAQELPLSMPPHVHSHAGSAADSEGSMAPAAVPLSSSGHVPVLARPAASRAAQLPEQTCDSGAKLPKQAMMATGQAGTAAHDSGLGPSLGTVSVLSSIGQSPGPQSAGLADASMQRMVPDQEHQLSSSKAALSMMEPFATGQHGAPHHSSAALQPACVDDQDAADLGCFAEHCGTAMQVSVWEANSGGPGSAALLGRRAVAASSSVQEVAESRSVWMQLSAVFSEADGILEDASSSCGGLSRSRSSRSVQAGHDSPGSGQSCAPGDVTTASCSGDHESASCSNLQISTLPAEAAGTHAASAIQSDADHEHPAAGAGPCRLANAGMTLPVQAAAPAAPAAGDGDAQPLPGCPAASALQGSQLGPPSSGAAKLPDRFLKRFIHTPGCKCGTWMVGAMLQNLELTRVDWMMLITTCSPIILWANTQVSRMS